MLRSIVSACVLIAAGSSLVQAQHEHPAMPAGEIGSANIRFETSCSAAVKEDFNKGVALLHSFWFPEAIRTFESVASRDADCALAYWGMAMSQWGNPFAGLRTPGIIERGQALIAKARGTGKPSAREKRLIDAAANLYRSSDAASQRQRVLDYEAAMTKLAQDHPDDAEIAIFQALAITQTASPTDKTYAALLRAAGILEPLFEKYPEHPGLAHYIIHTYDVPPLASKALPAARRYASLAPAVPHALHMPSHTFSRMGFWQESIATNRRSAAASRANNEASDELHALDYLGLRVSADGERCGSRRGCGAGVRHHGTHAGRLSGDQHLRGGGHSGALRNRAAGLARGRKSCGASGTQPEHGSHHAFRARTGCVTRRQTRVGHRGHRTVARVARCACRGA